MVFIFVVSVFDQDKDKTFGLSIDDDKLTENKLSFSSDQPQTSFTYFQSGFWMWFWFCFYFWFWSLSRLCRVSSSWHFSTINDISF